MEMKHVDLIAKLNKIILDNHLNLKLTEKMTLIEAEFAIKQLSHQVSTLKD